MLFISLEFKAQYQDSILELESTLIDVLNDYNIKNKYFWTVSKEDYSKISFVIVDKKREVFCRKIEIIENGCWKDCDYDERNNFDRHFFESFSKLLEYFGIQVDDHLYNFQNRKFSNKILIIMV